MVQTIKKDPKMFVCIDEDTAKDFEEEVNKYFDKGYDIGPPNIVTLSGAIRFIAFGQKRPEEKVIKPILPGGAPLGRI